MEGAAVQPSSPSTKAKFSFNGGFSSAQLTSPTELACASDGHPPLPYPEGATAATSTRTRSAGANDSDSDSDPAREGSALPEGVETGSSVRAAIFNFTNAIIGAGAIGLGGAFALSGGAVSIVSIITCAYLTKISLDLVLELSLAQGVSSYEDLGYCGLGRVGKLCVTWSKLLYSFGCLIAYVIVIKDNLGPALLSLVSDGNGAVSPPLVDHLFHNANSLTFLTSALVILPLCLLRDMTPLANFSMLSVLAMIMIVGIVALLYFVPPTNEHHPNKETSVYEDWFEIRWNGYLQSLGTFVFTFVSQHMVHMAYQSLKPELRTLDNWKLVSSWSLSLASAVSLSVGLFAYMTFWQAQGSDIFEMYPNLAVISFARLLLCGTMLLTFPLPFFTCRELLILMVTEGCVGSDTAGFGDAALAGAATSVNSRAGSLDEENCDLEVPLLSAEDTTRDGVASSSVLPHWLISKNQLRTEYHVLMTAALWLVTTCLAIVAPNLGDILAIVGCATGSAIAFVLPSMLAIKLQGYSHKALVLLVVGVVVLFIGTFCSGKKLVQDVYKLV